MTSREAARAWQRIALPGTGSWTTAAAFLLGLPMAAGVLALILAGPWNDPVLVRYVSHPVEVVEIVLFFCALAALGAKWVALRGERTALRTEVLPVWDGEAVPASHAEGLLDGLDRLGGWLRRTYLVRRVASVLDFVRSRRSANELDDQLRSLADADALALEGSYSLVRFITWAIPILGFLGTVLGITEAIHGVTPEVLEKSLSQVTGGLAVAFDTTALALALTMVIMFCTFVVERQEQGTLEVVDRYAEEELGHRFERTDPDHGTLTEVVRQNTQVLLRGTEELVQKQAALWARTVEQAEQRWAAAGEQYQARLTASLEAALDLTLEAHARRINALEEQVFSRFAGLLDRLTSLTTLLRDTGREQQASLAKVVQAVTAQAETLAQLQQDEKQLLRLQEHLNHNLAALNESGAFEQAVHSLTAAIHLLTARTGNGSLSPTNRLGQRPGSAA